MLPSNLLRSKISQGQIHPIYATLDSDIINLAERMIKLFDSNISIRKGDITESLKNFEEEGFDYRLVRGLFTLLERRCDFEIDCTIVPREARKIVFREASVLNIVTPEQRLGVIEKISKKLNISPNILEKSLYGDIENELILKNFKSIESKSLVKYYNFSLTQTLLFKSLRMDFSASGNWKNIFKSIRYLGMMYSVEQINDEYVVSVEGPISLFKMTERYGTSIAKLLPKITEADSWRIRAEVLGRDRTRVYVFEIKSNEVNGLLEEIVPRNIKINQEFDSSIEKKFSKRFSSCNSDWILKREPEPLIAGSYVMIPDFSFERNGMKVYLEIIGFWTPEYLEKKIAKLLSIKNVDIIIAVDEKLACSKLKKLKGPVIYYTKDIPLKPIFDHLNSRQKGIIKTEAELLRTKKIELNDDLVRIDTISKAYGVSIGAVRDVIKDLHFEGYRRIGEYYIIDKKFKELETRIEELEKMEFEKIVRIIEEYGLDNHNEVLEELNYTTTWHGLDSDNVEINKKLKHSDK